MSETGRDGVVVRAHLNVRFGSKAEGAGQARSSGEWPVDIGADQLRGMRKTVAAGLLMTLSESGLSVSVRGR